MKITKDHDVPGKMKKVVILSVDAVKNTYPTQLFTLISKQSIKDNNHKEPRKQVFPH